MISLTGIRRRWARALAIALVVFYIPWGARQAFPPRNIPVSGVVSHIAVRDRVIALAFADGPQAAVINNLADQGDQATFFVVGLNVERQRRQLKEARLLGNDIESHTLGHINLAVHTYQQDLTDLARANQAIRRATGVAPHWLYPPYAAMSGPALAAARRLHLKVLLPAPADRINADQASVAALVHQTMARVRPGAVIVIHWGSRSAAFSQALPIILGLLRARGYRVTSVADLWTAAHATRSAESPRR